MNNTSEPFIEGVQISAKKARIKHLINRVIFILIAIQGIRGLYISTRNIIFVYPKLSLYYKELNFDPHVYAQIMQQAVILSLSSMIETGFGLTMAIKKSSSIKTMYTIAGIIILLTSLYLKREGALPDLSSVEKLALLFK